MPRVPPVTNTTRPVMRARRTPAGNDSSIGGIVSRASVVEVSVLINSSPPQRLSLLRVRSLGEPFRDLGPELLARRRAGNEPDVAPGASQMLDVLARDEVEERHRPGTGRDVVGGRRGH